LGNFIGWFPFDPHVVGSKLEFTVLTEDQFSNAGVQNLSTGAEITIYPNPTDQLQHLDITLKTKMKLSVKLFDLNGREILSIFEGEAHSENMNFQINTNNFKTGLYVYRIEIGEKMYYKKMIVQQ